MNKLRGSLDKIMMGYLSFTRDNLTKQRTITRPSQVNIPNGIILAITLIDGNDTQLYEDLSKVLSEFNQKDLCGVVTDDLNIQSLCTYTGNLQTEDIYEERLKKYNKITEGLEKLDLLEKEGFKVSNVQQPVVEYSSSSNVSDWKTEEKRSCTGCYIRVVADFRSDFYREFYLKGLLDACRNNVRKWVLRAFTCADSIDHATSKIDSCRIKSSKMVIGRDVYVLNHTNTESHSSGNPGEQCHLLMNITLPGATGPSFSGATGATGTSSSAPSFHVPPPDTPSSGGIIELTLI